MPPTETEKQKGEQLLQKLRETPTDSVTRGVSKVEGLSKADEEDHHRWLKAHSKRLRTKLLSWFLHFLFFVVCVVVLVIVGTALYLTAIWIWSFKDDSVALGSFLEGIWNISLVALATLFIQSILPRD